MNDNFIRTIGLAVIAAMFCNCQSSIDIDFPDFEPKLVINAQLSADSSFIISVAVNSSPASTELIVAPKDIEVSLMDVSEQAMLPLERHDGFWKTSSDVVVRPGAEYVFSASADGFAPVTALSRIPNNIVIDSLIVLDFQASPSEVTPAKTNLSYTLHVSYDPHATDYLHIIFRQRTTIRTGTIIDPVYSEVIYVLEPEFPEEDGHVDHIDGGVLVDLGSARSNPLVFDFTDYTVDALQEELGNVVVEIRTVSPEYFYFFSSLSRQVITSQDPFAEPVPIFSNVTGGLGNFSGFSSEIYEVSLF